MALIKCFECGEKMSDKAKACPHCGYVTSKSVRKRLGASCLPATAISTITVLIFIAALINSSSTLFWLGIIVMVSGILLTSFWIERDRRGQK